MAAWPAPAPPQPSCTATRATTTPTWGAGYAGGASRRGIESSDRLGRHRWVVGRAVSWLSGCRRLHRRYERKPEHFLAFVGIAATLICHRRLAK
jgi:transposase